MVPDSIVIKPDFLGIFHLSAVISALFAKHTLNTILQRIALQRIALKRIASKRIALKRIAPKRIAPKRIAPDK
tara:strand:+ start:122 stop:340 length:219 start_codon:yes stop_codon:yes gene_type:complete